MPKLIIWTDPDGTPSCGKAPIECLLPDCTTEYPESDVLTEDSLFHTCDSGNKASVSLSLLLEALITKLGSDPELLEALSNLVLGEVCNTASDGVLDDTSEVLFCNDGVLSKGTLPAEPPPAGFTVSDSTPFDDETVTLNCISSILNDDTLSCEYEIS
ncbi:hypothetical protein N9043_00700 [bacterium]|nr:hypothetical protein [bacterium]